MHHKTVYIAGPLFTEAERHYLESLAEAIEELGGQVFLPHRDAGLSPAENQETRCYFEADKKAIEQSQLMVAILNGAQVDDGTACEIGVARTLGKYIIGVVDDIRICNYKTGINLFVLNCLDYVGNLKDSLLAIKTYIQTG